MVAESMQRLHQHYGIQYLPPSNVMFTFLVLHVAPCSGTKQMEFFLQKLTQRTTAVGFLHISVVILNKKNNNNFVLCTVPHLIIARVLQFACETSQHTGRQNWYVVSERWRRTHCYWSSWSAA